MFIGQRLPHNLSFPDVLIPRPITLDKGMLVSYHIQTSKYIEVYLSDIGHL